MYGRLSKAQAAAVTAVVRGQRVIDLGCGFEELSTTLLRTCHAAHVIALDYKARKASRDPGITSVRSAFSDYDGDVPAVAFLSWPDNRPLPGLLPILNFAKVVVYLGKNTGYTSCGWCGMFEALAGRELLAHVPETDNTLLVYGPARVTRALTGEEYAAIYHSSGRPMTFAKARAYDRQVTSKLKVHYSGSLCYGTSRSTTHVAKGFAACCSGERAMAIRRAGRATRIEDDVTCKSCLAALSKRVACRVHPRR